MHTDYDLDRLPEIAPEELAGNINDPALRAQLVNGMTIVSLANGEQTKSKADQVRAYATHVVSEASALVAAHKARVHAGSDAWVPAPAHPAHGTRCARPVTIGRPRVQARRWAPPGGRPECFKVLQSP